MRALLGHNAPVPSPDLDELLALVCRDLAAEDARITDVEPPAEDERHAVCELPNSRWLVVTFPGAPSDIEVKRRRLELFASAFETALTEPRRARPSPARSLFEELTALSIRAGAIDALVIDAQSPAIWGAAGGLDEMPANETEPGEEATVRPRLPISARVLDVVRASPEMHTLHKGGHLHRLVNDEDSAFVARSFAAIYVLVLVYTGPFDELRAHRAVTLALPHIEGLVLALPPLDPAPQRGAVVAMRPRPRRR